MEKIEVVISYKNHNGETRDRVIQPSLLFFGHTEWHPELQWLLEAFDVEKKEKRTFAMKDISSWRPR